MFVTTALFLTLGSASAFSAEILISTRAFIYREVFGGTVHLVSPPFVPILKVTAFPFPFKPIIELALRLSLC